MRGHEASWVWYGTLFLLARTDRKGHQMPSIPILFNEDGLKACNTCKILKSREEFNRDKNTKSGYSLICRECQKMYKKAYRSNDQKTLNELKRKKTENKIDETILRRSEKLKLAEANKRFRESIGAKSRGALPKIFDENGFKECSSCKEFKHKTEYYRDSDMSTGYASRCKYCAKIASQKSMSKDERRLYRLMWKYGVSKDKFLELMDKQNASCAICSHPFDLELGNRYSDYYPCVDHCHSTGKIRGLLCRSCNLSIGYAKDDKETLLSAIKYLNPEEVS